MGGGSIVRDQSIQRLPEIDLGEFPSKDYSTVGSTAKLSELPKNFKILDDVVQESNPKITKK